MRSHFSKEARRAALALLGVGASRRLEGWAIDWMHAESSREIAQVLVGDGIDQVFLHAVERSGMIRHLPARLVRWLISRRYWVVGTTTVQRHVLGEACALLDDLGIEYVVFKGALLREEIYAEPHLRPSADLDLLVARNGVLPAVRMLERHGYASAIAPYSDTHELSLSKQGVYLDLHWHLFRPSRMRQDVTREILHQRVRRNGLYAPKETHQTVAMLVHPAITDHVTGKLIHAWDLDLWLRRHRASWDEVMGVLDRIGLRTAAWTTLLWANRMLGTSVPSEVGQKLAPSIARRRYLELWLKLDPAQMYRRRPWLIRGAFSLALHDRARDVARAVWRQLRSDRLALSGTVHRPPGATDEDGGDSAIR